MTNEDRPEAAEPSLDDSLPDPVVPDAAKRRKGEQRGVAPRNKSGLLSRHYRPRHDGPDYLASWPLGAPPRQTGPDDVDWRVESRTFVTLQRNLTVNHLFGAIDESPIYLGVRGRCRVTDGATLTLRVEPIHLDEPDYGTTIHLKNTETEPFMTPMDEFLPTDRDAYREHSFIGREMYGGYVLSAKVTGGTGYIDQGTAVHLWSG